MAEDILNTKGTTPPSKMLRRTMRLLSAYTVHFKVTMPALQGFSDNTFTTRIDFLNAALALINPLEQYKSPEKARIKLATASGAGFSETAAQLEGFSRPLWVVASLLRFRNEGDKSLLHDAGQQLESWITGLKVGTDPKSTEYWGDLLDFDQRMVEMESIALSLLSSPSIFNFADDGIARENLTNWLNQINSHTIPLSNWRWFRILVNLAMIKSLNMPRERVQAQIDADFEVLDSFYLGDGWSSDGLWGDERKQADYYSGSFAIQFAQLLYVKYASDHDTKRVENYKCQAREFSIQYWRYFDEQGAAIAFGRSLTYRFAFAAFWSVVALAEIDLPAPLNHPGIVKGLLLRHMRWWAKHHDIFNTDGTLNIGYTYPNMYLSEDYNSPQSVYWCLKSFVALGVPPDHSFWTSEELSHPILGQLLPSINLIWPPKHIMCNTSEHHFLLSSGQSTRKNHKAREAKYSKFAYSSAFTFSVPNGPLLEQTAPDSVLCISQDDGDMWRTRWEPYDIKLDSLSHGIENVPVLISTWRPWNKVDLIIETRLIPPFKKWPGWHLRVHIIRSSFRTWRSLEAEKLIVIDSGFAISAQTLEGDSIFEKPVMKNFSSRAIGEGCWQNKDSSLIVSESGASGVVDLSEKFCGGKFYEHGLECHNHSKVIRPNANTNLIAPRTLIPSAYHVAKPQEGYIGQEERLSWVIVTGVFAVEATKVSKLSAWELWESPPTGRLENKHGTIILSCDDEQL